MQTELYAFFVSCAPLEQEEKSREAAHKPKFWLPAPSKTKVVDPGFAMRVAAAAQLSLPQTPFEYVGKSARLKPKHYYYAEWMLPTRPCHPLHLKEVDRMGISYHERIQLDGARRRAGGRRRAKDESSQMVPRQPKEKMGKGSKGRWKGRRRNERVRRGREVARKEEEEVSSLSA